MRNGRLARLVLLLVMAAAIAGCANKWKTSGKIAMGSKNWDKAISDFQRALEQTPNDGEVHYLLAAIYKDKGEYKAMLPHLQAADTLYEKAGSKIKDLRESAWKELFESGNNNIKNNENEKAKDEFELAAFMIPDNHAAYTNAGYAWQLMGNSDSAFFYFSEAYRIDPENIKVMENLASFSFGIGKYALADSIYKRILEKDPKNVDAMVGIGSIAEINEDFETAKNLYLSALELEKENCALWFNLGVLYFQRLKNSEEALTAFAKAIEYCPEDANAHINLNVVLIYLERFDEAAERLEIFTQDFPAECVGWDLYSQALLRKGMKSKALQAEDKFKECQKSGK